MQDEISHVKNGAQLKKSSNFLTAFNVTDKVHANDNRILMIILSDKRVVELAIQEFSSEKKNYV